MRTTHAYTKPSPNQTGLFALPARSMGNNPVSAPGLTGLFLRVDAMDSKPKNTGKFGPGNPGKPKGALSHTTKTAKEAIALAAEGLGGTQRLIDWCKEDPANERAFWSSIYPKLLPLQVTGEGGGPLLCSWLE